MFLAVFLVVAVSVSQGQDVVPSGYGPPPVAANTPGAQPTTAAGTVVNPQTALPPPNPGYDGGVVDPVIEITEVFETTSGTTNVQEETTAAVPDEPSTPTAVVTATGAPDPYQTPPPVEPITVEETSVSPDATTPSQDTTLGVTEEKIVIQPDTYVPTTAPPPPPYKQFRAAKSENLDVGEDAHEHCCWWALIGECEDNEFWMKPHCQRSCGTPACSVRNAEKCPSKLNVDDCPWKGLEHLSKKSPRSDGQFKQSAGAPKKPLSKCEDQSDFCPYWRKEGECEGKNKIWMHRHCSVSCGKCPNRR